MKKGKIIYVFFAVAVIFFLSCDDNDNGGVTTNRPIVFVHGFMGAGDNYANMIQSFLQNGYRPEELILFNYDTLAGDIPGIVDSLSEVIDGLIAQTGYSQVDLIGHSMGGSVGSTYVNREGNAGKVAHYIHAASFPDATFPSGLKVMTISSPSDTTVGYTEIPGADNQEITGADHLQVITLELSFEKAFTFFNDGAEPATIAIQKEGSVRIEGKVITLAENQPVVGAEIEVFAVDPETGERTSGSVASFLTDEEGGWGVLETDSDTYYEFYIETPGGPVTQYHYYRQPFLASQHAAYLRTMGSEDSSIGLLMGALIEEFSDDFSVVIFFSANQAVYAGRDTASIDGFDLATSEYADPEQTTIAYFFGDNDNDDVCEGTPGPLSEMPFLEQLDYCLPTDVEQPVIFELNGSELAVPNWKSKSEGIGLAVIDY
ncbi:MAG: alpha/beta fold hydrolase [Deltaproteobacteria bacterium]|nr:MAG: alpha/beta fold hydrolase [Deltaproteobacteria bacterium]